MCTKFGQNRSRRSRVMLEHTNTQTYIHFLYVCMYVCTHTRARERGGGEGERERGRERERVSQEECSSFREDVPYGKVYRCNPKHLSKVERFGDNGQRSSKL
jgi:hypothetical protein